ncbi:MAG: right-handed parallel beta-helix repeat-containing protein [Planctomycetes bacterium]|jgi:hypothetical protein|nr:right-handed parallel beta-helix repeat-containing protein [Planctomycetota bacterium]
MNARKVAMSVLLLAALGSAADAESVEWISGTTPPGQWSINPAHPTPTDVVTFSGPTAVYDSNCVAKRALGGTPLLTIDTKARTIVLWFQGPVPQVCPMVYNPVAGLRGDFGPLAVGDWTFTCRSRDLNFETHFTVQDKFAYHVDADAPGPAHDGRSWATAMRTLQDALAAAGSGDEIIVAEGTYLPDRGGAATSGDRAASFLLKPGLIVRGGFAGYGQPNPDERDIARRVTILSGDLQSDDRAAVPSFTDNSYHVVIGPADGLAARLDGFTVTAGNADGAFPHHYGGGLYNPDGKLQVVNCTFRGNTGVWGGAVMNFGPALTLANCQVLANRALMLGGGLYNYEGAATLINCRIAGNTAGYAETAGGAAVYNLNASVTILGSTIADNESPSGKAIANFTWMAAPGVRVRVANSILFNGGNELWSNVREAVEVTYSDVQGGWVGTGNISTDPQFTRSSSRGVGGEWVDGDYRLKSSSPAIDVGNNAALPADDLDLDADGNTTEPLPVDLDNEARIEGTKVDLGAYEQLAKQTPPTPSTTLMVSVGDGFLSLAPDPSAPSSSNTFIGSVDVDIELNFRGRLSVEVTPSSAAGGTWTAWLIPDTIGPGKATVTLWVKVQNLNLAALPAGAKDVQVAEVVFYVTPLF